MQKDGLRYFPNNYYFQISVIINTLIFKIINSKSLATLITNTFSKKSDKYSSCLVQSVTIKVATLSNNLLMKFYLVVSRYL
jgi:hypothetical protein